MAKEIERKFLVDSEKLKNVGNILKSEYISQSYISEKPVVRIRKSMNFLTQEFRCFLTIKGDGFLTRDEFEYEIPLKDFNEMISLCKFHIEKKRITLESGWEIDAFLGKNKGLCLAEYELESEDSEIKEIPDWIKEEVTGDPKYLNINLAK